MSRKTQPVKKPVACITTSKADESLLQGISQQLTCSICLEHYKTPKTVTPCLHTLCQDCLQETINSTATITGTKAKFSCPKCRGDVEFDCPNRSQMKDAAQTQFKTNFDIQNQLELVESKISSGCSKHSGEKLMYFCTDCKKTICPVCLLEDHLSNNHVLTSIAEESQKLQSLYKNKQRSIEQRLSNEVKRHSQNQRQQEKQSNLKATADQLIKILDVSTQNMSTFMKKVESRQKQITDDEEDIEKYQDDAAKLKDIMGKTDLQLVHYHEEISDLIDTLTQLKIKNPPPQQLSEADISKVFFAHMDELKQLANEKGWKYDTSGEIQQVNEPIDS